MNKLSGDVNIENMLLVEKGMRELASLKVEDAVALAMALSRRLNAIRSGLSGEVIYAKFSNKFFIYVLKIEYQY